jgi:hypothetical protein
MGLSPVDIESLLIGFQDNASLNFGIAIGAAVDGFTVKSHPCRYTYYVTIVLIGSATFTVYATFPETVGIRTVVFSDTITALTASGESSNHGMKNEEVGDSETHQVVLNESVSGP